MAKFLKNAPSGNLTRDIIDAYKTNLKANRALLPPVQTVADEVLQGWEKMGTVKREDYGGVLAVFLEHNAHLLPPLSVTDPADDITVYDGVEELIKVHKEEIEHLTRRRMIAGAKALNMLKSCELETTTKADRNDEAAIIAQNALNKLPKNNRPSPVVVKKSDVLMETPPKKKRKR